jgi:26S proteasome regulatory subunit N1
MAVAPADKPAEGAQKDAKAKPVEEVPDELSEEDQQLKDSLEALVAKLSERKEATVRETIDAIGKEIREATTSMTSVPKPLKFLRPHYSTVKAAYDKVNAACKQDLADVVSVLATVSAEEGQRDALDFCLKGTGKDPSAWGHEYIRHLAGEIAAEHDHRQSQEPEESVGELMALVKVRSPPAVHLCACIVQRTAHYLFALPQL